MTPRGCLTLLPLGAEKKRWIEDRLLDVFKRWGFQEIVTPIFEYLDILSLGIGSELIEKGYKLTDRSTGRLMILRPDITPQVARIAATALSSIRPLRLCYALNVFRYEEEYSKQREIHQVGTELIGLKEPEADAEIIAMAVEAIKTLQIKHCSVVVRQTGYIKGFFDGQGYDTGTVNALKKAIEKRDSSRIQELAGMKAISKKQGKRFLEIMELFGDEEVFKKAERLVESRVSEDALRNLRDVYGFLKKYGLSDFISFDLGELMGFDYHTGVSFAIFIKDFGYEIGGGGRYDQLLERFGSQCPATGFAFDIERVMEAMQNQGTGGDIGRGDFIIIDFTKDKTKAIELTKTLREKGYNVTRDIIRRNLDKSISYAKEVGIKKAIVLGSRGLKDADALIIGIETGQKEKVELRKIMERY